MTSARPIAGGRPSSHFSEHIGGWTVWLVCSLILSVLTLQFVNDWLNKDLSTLRDRQAGSSVPEGEIALNHHRLLLFGKVSVAMLLITGLLWVGWQFQAHTTLRTLGGSRPRFGPVTGLLAWAVPLLNLALVPLAFAELWLKSDPWEGTPDHEHWWTVAVVLVWWGFFLADVGLVTAAFGHGFAGAGAPAGFIARDELMKNAIFVSIGTGAMAAAMVLSIQHRLEGKDARLGR